MIIENIQVERLMAQISPHASCQCIARNTEYGIHLIWRWKESGTVYYVVRNIPYARICEFDHKLSAVVVVIADAKKEIDLWLSGIDQLHSSIYRAWCTK